MTLCIGALALSDSLSPRIVLCFDYMAANEYWGSEGEYKFHILSDRMVALAAGAPGKAKELALLYKAHLEKTDLSVAGAVEELRKPLATLKRRLANSYVARRLGFTYSELLTHGELWLGKERQARYLSAIEEHQPNVEMILAGFIGNDPVLCTISPLADGEGVVEVDVCTNFCLIGSGSPSAEPALHFRGQSFNTPLAHTLYNVYEAKRIGEISPYVGQKTRMYVLEPPDKGAARMWVKLVASPGEKFLEGLYRRHRPRPIRQKPTLPDNALQVTRFNLQ